MLTAIPEGLGQALGLVAELGPVTQTVLDRVAYALDLPCPDAGAVPLLAQLGVAVERRLVGRTSRTIVVPVVARVMTAVRLPEPGGSAGGAAARVRLGKRTPRLRGGRFVRPAPGTVQRTAARRGTRRRPTPLAGRSAAGVVERPAHHPDRTEVLQRTYADALRLSGFSGAALLSVPAPGGRCQHHGLDGRAGHACRRGPSHAGQLPGGPGGCLELSPSCLRGPGADRRRAGRVAGVPEGRWRCSDARAGPALGGHDADGRGASWGPPRPRRGAPRRGAGLPTAPARRHTTSRPCGRPRSSGDAVTANLVLANQSHLELALARFAHAAVPHRPRGGAACPSRPADGSPRCTTSARRSHDSGSTTRRSATPSTRSPWQRRLSSWCHRRGARRRGHPSPARPRRAGARGVPRGRRAGARLPGRKKAGPRPGGPAGDGRTHRPRHCPPDRPRGAPARVTFMAALRLDRPRLGRARPW